MSRQQKRKVLTVDEAAHELGICRNAAYAAVKEGQIPSIRIGNRIIIPRAAFDTMLERVGESAPTPEQGIG